MFVRYKLNTSITLKVIFKNNYYKRDLSRNSPASSWHKPIKVSAQRWCIDSFQCVLKRKAGKTAWNNSRKAKAKIVALSSALIFCHKTFWYLIQTQPEMCRHLGVSELAQEAQRKKKISLPVLKFSRLFKSQINDLCKISIKPYYPKILYECRELKCFNNYFIAVYKAFRISHETANQSFIIKKGWKFLLGRAWTWRVRITVLS